MITIEDWDFLLEEIGSRYLLGVPSSELQNLFKNTVTETIVNTREDESIGMACGLSLTGVYPLVAMQSSGVGNIINSIASLVIPYNINMKILVSNRGGDSEKNAVQQLMGKYSSKFLKDLGLIVKVPNNKLELFNLIKTNESKPTAIIIDHEILIGGN